jgi:NADPH:quinone reductase-like Zn-dependent oxidoreductase
MEREGTLVYNEVHFPRVLGGECAGTIVAIGDGSGVLPLAIGFTHRAS